MKPITLALLLASFLILPSTQAQIIDTTFFTPASFFESISLKQTQNGDQIHVFSNTSEEDYEIDRVVDIRWVFKNTKAAKRYFEKNLQKQSENGWEYQKDIALPNASIVHVYRDDKMSASMYEMMGLTHVHWNYIFLIDRVMVKVFVAGHETSFKASYQVALAAAEHVSTQLGKKVKYEPTVLQTALDTAFSNQVKAYNLDFHYPPGFETQPIPEDLQRYFDQELILPGRDFAIRYYIIPPAEADSVEDSLDYEAYCKRQDGRYMSIAINIMMPDPFRVPPTKVLDDQEACKEAFNGDYKMMSFFEIGEGSTLAKGYDYCYMYGLFKKGAPSIIVFYLSKEKEVLEFSPQLFEKSIKYGGE